MRIAAFLFCVAFCIAVPLELRAQNPGAQQDAEAAREKLLKASDELDNIQANSEATRASVDGVKTDVASLQQTVTKLQNDNATLKQQLADMQAAFEQYKTTQDKARQQLIDNVADMIANSGGKTTKKKKDAVEPSAQTSNPPPSTEVHTAMQAPAPSLAPPPDKTVSNSTDDTPPPAPKKEKGYIHTVASGETVSIIAAAFRDQGVKVTASQIRKANGLTADSVLKPGQKLFIPKPGT